MSTLAHSDSETVSQTNGARSSRVPIPLPNDHYMAVRQAYLATIRDSKSEPFEDYIETEIPQPLPISSSLVPSSDDPYLIVGHAHTPATIDTESEQDEAPSEIKELYLTNTISDRSYTEEVSDDTPTHRIPVHTTWIDPEDVYCSVGTRSKRMHWMDARALRKKDAFRGERPSGDTICDPWIFDRETRTTVDKRFRCQRQEGTDSEGEESEDEGHDLEGYEAARRRALELAEEIAPSTFKVGQSSRTVPDQQMADGTLTPRTPACTIWIDPEDASPVTTLATTIAVDEDEFLEVGAHLELHGSLLHDYTQRLDALPPTLLEGHGRDIIELFDRSRAVREEIHS
ncbi:hypothetical protein Tco_0888389 [Tanacetum coccineum]